MPTLAKRKSIETITDEEVERDLEKLRNSEYYTIPGMQTYSPLAGEDVQPRRIRKRGRDLAETS